MGHSIEAHINYVDKFCNSPLHLAVRGGSLEVIQLCMAYGAKINRQQVRLFKMPITLEQCKGGC